MQKSSTGSCQTKLSLDARSAPLYACVDGDVQTVWCDVEKEEHPFHPIWKTLVSRVLTTVH